MSTNQRDHCKVINESMCGLKPIDDETYLSVAVLSERLENLKATSNIFSEVGFSPDVEELASCDMISAIC